MIIMRPPDGSIFSFLYKILYYSIGFLFMTILSATEITWMLCTPANKKEETADKIRKTNEWILKNIEEQKEKAEFDNFIKQF